MNSLLLINKKIILIIIFVSILLSIVFFSFNYFDIKKKNINIEFIETSESDISEPKFTIASENNKILISAKEGNFIDEYKILLKKDVKFTSSKFKIYSDNVIFDKKKLNASSVKSSKFVSKNTIINSEGFDITEHGSVINFKGKTILKIK